MPSQSAGSRSELVVAIFVVVNLLALSGSGCSSGSDEEGNTAATGGKGSGGKGAGGSMTGGSSGSGAAGSGSGGGSGSSGAGGTDGAGAGGTTGSGGGGSGTGGTGTGGAGTGGSGTGGSGTGGSGTGGSGTGGTGTGGAGTGGTGTGGTGNTGGADVSTDANLKVAFIGDTSVGSDYQSVLDLIKSESADGLLVQGDMSYSDNPTEWWADTEQILGTSFPIFISRGNHDDISWSGYLPKANAHLGGATRVAGAHDANYKTTWRGLVIATIRKGDSAAAITPFLANEPHIWKICQWHQNQQAMQVGGKGNEMGWEVYEACRQAGAIIETGHEHSYERTKTLTSMSAQTVDLSCASPTSLCVSPGRTFANVVGLGGNSIRAQLLCLPSTPPYGCKGEWAFIYTSNQSAKLGAQFITFNANDPRKATGYFKNVDGVTVDTFTINYGP